MSRVRGAFVLLVGFLLAALLLGACQATGIAELQPSPDGGAAPVDGGPADGGKPPGDAGPDDAGTPPDDAGPDDAGAPPEDAGPDDAGTPPDDAGPDDGGTPPEDAGLGDSGPEDAGPDDAGPVDGGVPPAGRIRIDPAWPHSFVYDDGRRFFPMGDTSYSLLDNDEIAIHDYLVSRRNAGFTFVRAGAHTTEGTSFWPYGGTRTSPDFYSVNEQAMQKLDRVFDDAEAIGIHIELLCWTYAEGTGNWGDPGAESFWVDTLARRFGARPGLFMFTISNEFENYDGNNSYIFEPRDVDWARRMADRIQAIAPDRPVGVHPSVWVGELNVPYTYDGFTQRRPQVVWPLWESSASVTVYAVQNNQGVHGGTWDSTNNEAVVSDVDWQGTYYPVSWTSTGWDFEGAGLEDSIAEDWSHAKPVINLEFGYQYETGTEAGPLYRSHQAHQPNTVRKKAWRIVTAGGYFAAGFATSWNYLGDWGNWHPQQLTVLKDFFVGRTEYWTMAPHLDLVAEHNSLLALPGVEYVAYFPRGGTNRVDLAAGSYAVEWLDPRTGALVDQGTGSFADGPADFTPPFETDLDWVLHMKR